MRRKSSPGQSFKSTDTIRTDAANAVPGAGPGSGDWKMRITHDAMALTGTGASESSTA